MNKHVYKYIFSIIVCILFIQQSIQSQDEKSGIYIDSQRNVYIQADKPIYLYIATDTLQSPKRVDVHNKNNPERNFIKISKHGKHHIKHWNITENAYEELIVNIDALKPKTTINVSVDNEYVSTDKQYYGKNLKIGLLASDDMSKVKKTFYSINNSPFKEYINSITFDTDGLYNFRYYSIDNVGNIEEENDKAFMVDTKSPKTEFSIEGTSVDTIYNADTKLKLHATDNLSGVKKINYQIDGGKWHVYNNKYIYIGGLEDDEHSIDYYAEDELGNEEEKQVVSFYIDKKPPLASLISIGDKFVLKDKVYFSGRTKLILIALDNKSGVDSIMYSVDNQEYKSYNEAFYLPHRQGVHSVKYYAVDKLGNKGIGNDKYSVYKQESDMFVVDLLGPDIYMSLLGKHIKINNKIYVNDKTQIKITAKDKESGLKNIKYSIDNDTSERDYNRPITLNDITDGKHSLIGIAYDNVNNRNIKNKKIIIDRQGPDIFYYFSVTKPVNDGTEHIIPAYAKLFLAATDKLTGIKEIRYSVNKGKYIKYIRPITNFLKNKKYNIHVKSTDKLGNENTRSISFSTY